MRPDERSAPISLKATVKAHHSASRQKPRRSARGTDNRKAGPTQLEESRGGAASSGAESAPTSTACSARSAVASAACNHIGREQGRGFDLLH